MVRFEDSDDARAAPSQSVVRVAEVVRSGYGDREVRFSYDAETVRAIKQCANSRRWASWDPDRRCWVAGVSVWPCVRDALTTHGFTIREAVEHG